MHYKMSKEKKYTEREKKLESTEKKTRGCVRNKQTNLGSKKYLPTLYLNKHFGKETNHYWLLRPKDHTVSTNGLQIGHQGYTVLITLDVVILP